MEILYNFTSEELFYIVVAICLMLVAVAITVLVFALIRTLKRVNRALDSLDQRLCQVEPVLDKVVHIEDKVDNTLDELGLQVEKLQMDVSLLVANLSEAAATYKRLGDTLDERLQQDIPPLLQEAHLLLNQANALTQDVQKKIKTTDNLFHAIDDAGQTVRMVTGIVKGGFTGLAVQLASMAVGVKRSLEYVTDNIHKGGKKDE